MRAACRPPRVLSPAVRATMRNDTRRRADRMPGELHRWRHDELIREGDLLAEVPVEGTYDDSWSPRISLADARKLEEVRLALRRGDIAAAARHGRVFAMKPIAG